MDKNICTSIEKNSVLALIPARAGSKGVPNKNIRVFRDHPIVAYSIAAAVLSRQIDRVIVTTDSEEIADVARKYGAEVPFLRPAEYAGDDSPDIEFVAHAIEWLYKNEGKIPEYIVHLRPTSPLRDWNVIDEAIHAIKENPQASALRSCSVCVHSPYKWFARGENGYLKPLLDGVTNDGANMPRQRFPEVYAPNGYVDVLKTEFVVQNGLLHGESLMPFLTREVPDIDAEEDFNRLDEYPGIEELTEKCEYLSGIV
jgi:CMP-N-acetylneuraminic acid synthetase